MLQNLRSVIYHAPDIKAARDWYAAVLGFAPYVDELFYVGFQIGGSELGLDPDAADTPGGNAGSVAYWRVANIEEVRSRLLELGAKLRSDVQEMGGIRIATFLDPFDNILGVIQEG